MPRGPVAAATLTGVLTTSLALGVAGPELSSATAAALPHTPLSVASQIKDINATLVGGRPSQITDVNGTVFFTAYDLTHGRELWKSDGTPGGTTLVKDIAPGKEGSYPANLTNVNGTLYFGANDGSGGYELWKSDGTAAGTVLVKDIASGPTSSYPSNLTSVNGTLYFSANDGSTGPELWKSDGTAAGTVRVKDIRPGPGGSLRYGAQFTNVNGTLFFTADDGTAGAELWKSDGTTAGTVLVKDIHPGDASYNYGSYPSSLTNVNGTLFFAATDGTTGTELWKSDGTAAGTVQVKDINPGSGSSIGGGRGYGTSLLNVNGTLFFTANDGTTGTELWKSDGTDAGTVQVSDINPGSASSISSYGANLTNINGTVFFTADDGTTGTELWKSDGTMAGTVQVKDINPGSGGSFGSGYYTSSADLTDVNGTLFFSANDGTNGYELWKSDGTDAGTVAVSSGPANYLTNVNGTLFFGSFDASSGSELWKSDGTEAGTVAISSIYSGDFGSYPGSLVNENGTLYFSAADSSGGSELWKSDGTAAGTTLVKDINPGPNGSYPTQLTDVNGTLYFTAATTSAGRELWKTDGTADGTVLVKDINPGTGSSLSRNGANLLNVNGTLFFTANDGTTGNELWKSDGTEAGTVQVKDINPGSGSGFAGGYYGSGGSLTNVNGTLFFSANDGTTGNELWKSDGTEAGTVQIKDVNPGDGSSISNYGDNLVNLNGTLLFAATDGTTGNELWKSNGTTAGTVQVKDIHSGSADGVSIYGANFTKVNGNVFFAADNGITGTELWKSNGTNAGTVEVKDIRPGNRSGISDYYGAPLTNVNGILFFAADDGKHGVELWRSDGTKAGTIQVKDIQPGTGYYSYGSEPVDLTGVNGALFFVANNGTTGRELWMSDGSKAGTVEVKDIRPGGGSSFSDYGGNLTDVNGTLFFAANDGVTGPELWKATAPPPAPARASLGKVTVSRTAATATITCTGAIGKSCSVTLTMKEKAVVVGKATKTIATGGSEPVKVPLNAKGKKLLAQLHTLRAKLSVSQNGKKVGTKTLTFKSAKKH
ncbi:MAG TPA: ELWxxDGT repeat protein [Gaiellaceae bacterium]